MRQRKQWKPKEIVTLYHHNWGTVFIYYMYLKYFPQPFSLKGPDERQLNTDYPFHSVQHKYVKWENTAKRNCNRYKQT